MNKRIVGIFVAAFGLCLLLFGNARAETVAYWDFTKGAQGWRGNGFLQKTGATAEGLIFTGIGVDPWMAGPAFDCPDGKELLVRLKMKTDSGTNAVLYYGKEFTEERKARFDTMPDSEWREYSVFLPPLEEGARLRLDPFPEQGNLEIAWIQVVSAAPLAPPEMKKPGRPGWYGYIPENAPCPALMYFSEFSWNGYLINYSGVKLAAGYEHDSVGYLSGGRPAWMPTDKSVRGEPSGDAENPVATFRAEFKDADGVNWKFARIVKKGKVENSIDVEVSVEVDRDRDVIHIPWLTLFPGLEERGGDSRKTQALFSGLEYLADEPSGSEADLVGPQSMRLVPDPVKITIPMMVIVKGGKYLGVIWEPSEYVAAVFDSPDRVFGSGAHLMALWAPGVGALRRENSLFAYDTFKLRANEPISVRFTIFGGEGDSVVPAIQKYVEMKGLPEVPALGGGFGGAVKLLAGGWLDSELHSDGLWRHAVGGSNFPFGRAADAPAFMLQLARLTGDGSLAERLRRGADRGLERLAETDPGTGRPYDADFRGGVGHVRFPVPPLLFGRVFEYVERAVAEAQQIAANNFDAKGIRRYTPVPGRLDYGKTHFADHANGLAAADIYQILDAARLSGDDDLLKKGLWLLDRTTELYANSEPRGAQTWEIPLHTPDILASAYLVKSYVLGYAMTGNEKYLEQAEYWAWTGVPFVYLYNPTAGAVGPYATIAVYGATNWESPNWIGLPVQWCGLVYASALYMLSEHDPKGPWLQIAKGITVAGLQMTYPMEDASRQGLLPDSYSLKSRRRNGPDINPGTVQANLAEIDGAARIYDFKRLPVSGWLVHAPCAISDIKESENEISFSLAGFGDTPYRVLIAKVQAAPAYVLSDSGTKIKYIYNTERGLLLLEGLKGRENIRIMEK